MILEVLGELNYGVERKGFFIDFFLEEDFSGDFREYSTVFYFIIKEEIVVMEGFGDVVFKDI